MTTITIDQALQSAKSFNLTALEGQLLMLHALGRSTQDRAWLLTHGHETLHPQTWALFENYAQKRCDHVPLSYLIGQKEFYGLNLQVDPRVLDPRADTETLVDWALGLLNDQASGSSAHQNMHVLDLGTGSGAIALAIKANTRHCTLWAIDKSQEALEVAKTNALKLGLDLHCVQSHWFEAWKDASQAHENLNTGGRRGSTLPQLFDLIVSNPPYIAPNDPHLKNLLHEPLNALIAQDEGMSDLRTIVQEARNHLNPGAWLILEHGYDQSAAVRNLMLEWGYFNVQSRSDLAGIERCTGAQWPKVK